MDGDYCRMHSPEHAQAVAESRRLGGLRRKREATLAGAYDFHGLGSVSDIIRLLEVVAFDTLGMDSSASKSRILISVSLAALKALEAGDHEQRLSMLEATMRIRGEPESEFAKGPLAFEYSSKGMME